jgi:hypothetical protein
LWAHRTSRHGATKVTPFELVYGQEAVLPVEVSLQNLRVTGQSHLSAKEYNGLMIDKIDDAPEGRFKALEEIEKEKVKIAKAYNKRVMENRLKLEIWYGKRFCRWGPEVVSLVSGHLAGKDRLELSRLCRVMLTSWKTLKDTYCQKL